MRRSRRTFDWRLLARLLVGVGALALLLLLAALESGCSALGAAAPAVLDVLAADARASAGQARTRRDQAAVEQLLREVLAAIEDVRAAQERAAEADARDRTRRVREIRARWVRLEGLLAELDQHRAAPAGEGGGRP